tara:strand:+ start:37 stop:198 length:162 start_codon:yes stop_codon:yes gene_type:complete
MPKITIDVHLPYDDVPEMSDDEVLVVEDIVDEEADEEIVVTCPTCGAVMATDL